MFLLGYRTGLSHGIDRGWQLADDHANELTRAAARVCRGVANLDDLDYSVATAKRQARYAQAAARIRHECEAAS